MQVRQKKGRGKEPLSSLKKEVEAGELSAKTVESLKKVMPCLIPSSMGTPLVYAVRERKPPAVKALCAHKEFFQEADAVALAYALNELESLEHLLTSKWVKQGERSRTLCARYR